MSIKIVKISLSILFLVLAIWFCLNNTESLSKLADIPFKYILILFIMHIVQLGLTAWIFKLNILVAGENLQFTEWVGLRLISQFANFISVFRGGAFAAFAYLKLKYKVKISILLAIFIINTGLTLFSLIPLLLIAAIYYQFSISLWYSTVILLPLSVIFLKILINFIARFQLLEFFSRRESMRKSLSLIDSNQNNWLMVVGVNWIIFYLAAWSFQISFLAINQATNFETNFTFVLLSTLSNLVSITPGNIGIQETIIALTSSKLDNVSFEDGIIAASIIRAINIILVTFGTLIFSKILFGSWKPEVDQLDNKGSLKQL